MKIVYSANIVKGEDGIYMVAFPDFPESMTDGLTLEEALQNASEALTLTLEGRMEEGHVLPEPKKKGKHLVAPAARVQGAVLLRMARGKRTLSEIARALGTSWPAAQKLEDPRHSPTLRQLEKAALVLKWDGQRPISHFRSGWKFSLRPIMSVGAPGRLCE